MYICCNVKVLVVGDVIDCSQQFSGQTSSTSTIIYVDKFAVMDDNVVHMNTEWLKQTSQYYSCEQYNFKKLNRDDEVTFCSPSAHEWWSLINE